MTPNRGGFAAAVLPGERRAGYGAALRPQGSLPRSLGDGPAGPPLTPEASAAPHAKRQGAGAKPPARPTARRSRPDPYKQSLYGYRGLARSKLLGLLSAWEQMRS